jgi:cell division protein ZapE
MQFNWNDQSHTIQFKPTQQAELNNGHACVYPDQQHSENFLWQCYQLSVQGGELLPDPAQERVVHHLQFIFDALLEEPATTNTGYLSRFFSFSKPERTSKPVNTDLHGLYIVGGVGRGKTHLMDLFFKCLPIKRKMRLHFHRFMQLIHDELAKLDGYTNPLEIVANQFAKDLSVLCLDEMHVNDIADAMILGELFKHLFAKGVVLITTSNSEPSALYKEGLQRARFLPAIELLKKNTKLVSLEGDIDYRLQKLQNQQSYIQASGQLSEQRLKLQFNALAGIQNHKDRTDIIINHRKIPVKKWADGVVWFDFNELCNTPRSTQDYIEIARYFHTVIISDISHMDDMQNDVARRFINMIDEFYDHHVKLIFSANTAPEQLYSGKKLAFEYERTQSRLFEMQSQNYMASEHVA